MIIGLVVESLLLLVIAIFLFCKKKPLIGWVFTLASLAGLVLAAVIIYLFPDKI